MAITSGSTICFAKNPKLLVGDYLLNVIKSNEIEAITVVPSILATILPDNCSPTLKYLEVCGEVLPNKLANIWKNRLKKFLNTYSPTETCVMATIYDILTEKTLIKIASTIGIPHDHTSIYICDPITEELNNLNKEQFIFHLKLQKRLYHSGDQGCILEDVETIILSKCPEIGYASVQVNEEKKSLVAFVMPKDLEHKVIQNKLNKTMPKFQNPYIIPVDNLPCTYIRKTNYSREILESEEEPDINANFFDLGGHSLSLLQLQKKIQLQISSIDIIDLFQNPTIKSITKSSHKFR
ncbi:non-ribosomal peptide synthetase [Gigaspora margarita]|uniref:Non-ribosomal peptide synthetase n=1 Tax=Gigaspora margarita TaxID=4874 RepID=A0A8H4AM18_GIGMA|nr:non-ribosomal peptide synthetase [Gigaspora margarita]